MLHELKVPVKKLLVLQLDNMCVINLEKNQVLYGKIKHIEVGFHFLREKMNQGKLEVRHCK